MATNGNFAQQDQLKLTAEQYPASIDASASNSNLSKDEVGWYFVEQYYTTLSKSPEKLHVRLGRYSTQLTRQFANHSATALLRQALPVRSRQGGRGRQCLRRTPGKHRITRFPLYII